MSAGSGAERQRIACGFGWGFWFCGFYWLVRIFFLLFKARGGIETLP